MLRLVRWLLCLYPLLWRERYEEEMLALIEHYPVTWRTVVDILFSAVDARRDFCFYRWQCRAHSAILWAFPLLAAGYMYFLDGLDDALYVWNRAHPDLWNFKVASEIAMAGALFAFLLIAFPLSLTLLFAGSRVSDKFLRWTLPAIMLIVLGVSMHLFYTLIWGYAVWNIPDSTVLTMARNANREIWAGNGWHLQIIGGILWMSLITGYIAYCIYQSFYSLQVKKYG